MGGPGSGPARRAAHWKRYTIRPRRGKNLPVGFHTTYMDACEQLGRLRACDYRICLDRIEDGVEVASVQLWPPIRR